MWQSPDTKFVTQTSLGEQVGCVKGEVVLGRKIPFCLWQGQSLWKEGQWSLHPVTQEQLARQLRAEPNPAHENRRCHWLWSPSPQQSAQSSQGFAPSHPLHPGVLEPADNLPCAQQCPGSALGWHTGLGSAGWAQDTALGTHRDLLRKMWEFGNSDPAAFTVLGMHKQSWWSFLCLLKEAWNKLFHVQSL